MAHLEVDAEVAAVLSATARAAQISENNLVRRLLGLSTATIARPDSSRTAPIGAGSSQPNELVQLLRPTPETRGLVEMLARVVGDVAPGVRFRLAEPSGKVVADPNFMSVKLQPRDRSLRISVFGDPSDLGDAGRRLGAKTSRSPYSEFKIESTGGEPDLREVLARARQLRSRRGRGAY